MNTTPTTTTRNADARAQFATTLAEKNALRTGYEDPEFCRLHDAFALELLKGLQKLSPRARLKDDPDYARYPSLMVNHLLKRLEKKGHDGVVISSSIYDKYSPLLRARADAVHEEVERLSQRLAELAPLAELRRAGPEGEWHHLDSRRAGDYRSQGYGALRYAEGSVQLTADVARAEGFVDGVDLVVLTARDYDDVVVAAVRVADAVDAEILRRCPPPPLREQVRLCWSRGINPRVLNPFLPHGYEEKAGLDFFGRDLRATSSTSSTSSAPTGTSGGVQ